MSIELLTFIEGGIPASLARLDGWSGLHVDYETPHVERLWRDIGGGYRLYLHRIHPCDEALFHPHPWPSVCKIVRGSYEMGVGYGTGNEAPPVAMRQKLGAGSIYEMMDPDGWHYVKPSQPSLSIMLTGRPWNRWSPGPARKLDSLSNAKAQELLQDFRVLYGVK